MSTKIEILEINLVNESLWDVHNDTCAICRNDLNEPSINSNKVNICAGICNHAYHKECINIWVCRKKKPTCPLCNREWIERKLN